jgi:hypothetical protein
MKLLIARRGVGLVIALLTFLLLPGCAGVGGSNGLSGDALFWDNVRNLVVDNWGNQWKVAVNHGNRDGVLYYYHEDYLHNGQDKEDVTNELIALYNDPYTYDIANMVCNNFQPSGSMATAAVAYDRIRIDAVNNQETTHISDTWHFIKVPTGSGANQYVVLIYGNQQPGP